jgi:acetolactate synthase-1/2/3 large subunit
MLRRNNDVVEVKDRTAETATGAQPMTGGQALVASLLRQGIDTIFGLPGVQLDGAFDALYDAEKRGDVRVIHPRHEQTTAYMADGYARTTGKVGTCLVVPGPGLLNASAALSTAYACNSPVLCVTGQIQSDLIGVGRGMLHEIPNQLEMIRSVAKHSERAVKPEEIPGLVDRALRALWDGRTRPVEIEIPPDTLFAEAQVELLAAAPERERPVGDPDKLEEAAKLLGNAEKPMIYSGGGVLNAEAWDELLTLAELLQAPVVMSSNGRGAISDRHYLGQNSLAGMELIQDADVVFCVGTRMIEPATYPWGLKPGRTVIQMDIDPEEVGRNYEPTVGIVADAKAGLAALAERVASHNKKRDSREDELTAAKARSREQLDGIDPQAAYAWAIRNELPDDGILVGEMTQVGYWSNLGFPTYQPRTYITPGYQGTLGWGFPTSLGVKVGNPDKVVVSINGDGGFGFALNELATMALHQIGTVAIVFNDSAYGNVRRIQQVSFDGRTIASHLQNPDYVKLAESFGVTGRRAESPEALPTNLREAIAANEPTLIEVPVEQMPDPWRELKFRG